MRPFLAPPVALLAILLIAAPVAAASWTHPASITHSHDAFPAYARSLAVGGDVTHLLDSRSTGQIDYRRSLDGGAHWSAPLTLAQPDTTFTSVLADPAIAARGSLVVFAYRAHDASAAYLFIRRSTDGGLSWGAPQQIARVVTNRRIGEQSVAISSAGVFVAWTDRVNGHIDLRRSTDGGAHFAPVKRVGTTTYTFFGGNPDFTDGLIGLAATGHSVYLAWTPTGDGPADSIVLSRSLDGGATFQGPTTVFVGPSFGWPSLAADDSDLVSEFQATDGTLWAFHSTDRGHTVGTRQLAAPDNSTTVAEGSVGIDDGDAVFSFSRSPLPSGDAAPVGKILVRRSHDGGAHWEASEVAARDVSGPGNVSTARTDDGTLLVYGTCQDSALTVCDLAAVRGN